MFSSLCVCHSFSIVGKQQDGAMESSQTKGNASPMLGVGGKGKAQSGGSPVSVAGAAARDHVSGVRWPFCRSHQKYVKITCEQASW